MGVDHTYRYVNTLNIPKEMYHQEYQVTSSSQFTLTIDSGFSSISRIIEIANDYGETCTNAYIWESATPSIEYWAGFSIDRCGKRANNKFVVSGGTASITDTWSSGNCLLHIYIIP